MAQRETCVGWSQSSTENGVTRHVFYLNFSIVYAVFVYSKYSNNAAPSLSINSPIQVACNRNCQGCQVQQRVFV